MRQYFTSEELIISTPGVDIGEIVNTKNSMTHIKTPHSVLKLSRLTKLLELTSFNFVWLCGGNKSGEKETVGQIKILK